MLQVKRVIKKALVALDVDGWKISVQGEVHTPRAQSPHDATNNQNWPVARGLTPVPSHPTVGVAVIGLILWSSVQPSHGRGCSCWTN